MVAARSFLTLWSLIFVCITGGSLQGTCLAPPSKTFSSNCSKNAECCATDSAGALEESHQTGSVARLTPRVFCPFTCEESVSCQDHQSHGTSLVVPVLRGSHGDSDHALQSLQQTLEAGELRCNKRQIRQQKQGFQERKESKCKESTNTARARGAFGEWIDFADVPGQDSLDYVNTEIKSRHSSKQRGSCTCFRSARRSNEQSFDGAAGAVQTAALGFEKSTWSPTRGNGKRIAGADACDSDANPDSQAPEPIDEIGENGVFNSEKDCGDGHSMARVCSSGQREVQQTQDFIHAEKGTDGQRFSREVGRAQQAEGRDFDGLGRFATEAFRGEPRSSIVGNAGQHVASAAIQDRTIGSSRSLPSRRGGLGCRRRGDDSSEFSSGDRWHQEEDGGTIFQGGYVSHEGAPTQPQNKRTRESQERNGEIQREGRGSGSKGLKSILKGQWLWEQPAGEYRNVKVRFSEIVNVRVIQPNGMHKETIVDSNDPESLSGPKSFRLKDKLDLDACVGYESAEYSGMQFKPGDGVSSKVVQAIKEHWKNKPEISIRLWFIEHNGFGTAASVYKKISSEYQLTSIWGYHCQLRDVHLISPNPSSPRHPADVHVLIAKNAFGAIDVLAEVLVDGYPEAKMTARVRGDTVRDVYRAAGYTRWLANPRLECMMYDGGTILHMDDPIDLYQGAFVSLHVRSIPDDETMSESEESTTCPEDSVDSITDEDDGISLLQHLTDPFDNHFAGHCWFDGSPCLFDRWCGS